MPRPKTNTTDKSTDFFGSVKRLFKELKPYKVLIALSLVLAIFGSILSILAPNRLSDLTDEIQKGITVNTENLNELNEKISGSFDEKTMATKMQELMTSDKISDADKAKLSEAMASGQTDDGSKKTDQKELIKNMPEDVMKYFLTDITIDGTKISVNDEYKYLTSMSSMDKNSGAKELYKKIDKMPDSIQDVLVPKMNYTVIKNIVIILGIMYFLSAMFTFIESISMTLVSNRFARRVRESISLKINKLPLSYFDTHSKGDILSRVTNDVDTIAQSMNQSLATLVSAVILFIGTLIMMFVTNSLMAVTAVVSTLVGFILMVIILSKSQKYFTDRQNGLGKINGHIEEIYSGLNIIKVYNAKKEADGKFDELNNKLYKSNKMSQFLSGLMMPIMNFIGNFSYVAVCIVGAILTMNGNITFGVVIAFISYVRLFTSPLSQIAQGITSLQSTAAASERVFTLLDEKEMPSEKDIKTNLSKENVKGNIEFKDVTFTYTGNENPTITDFSADVKSGQKVAIVGPTGAGKTTMVNLLMKFYDIDSGSILIDGVDTKNLTRENIHGLFTMVLQDTWIFEGTVKENIIYNGENISDELVEKVCKIVGLDHFIRTLPKGYDTVISDNDSVSAGQRQLITIARGMIERKPFLILDEATSNVDTRTEELVQKAMDKLTEGRTSFIIAHRLSTIKNADLILVMNDGNIIESGNHETLMAKHGFYADLYNSQFKL